ncbi:hypothetical protein GBA52_008629 [Prunus armeniaca]|nr:hypothetical protein GBA52_008629 [Prunus armeniaca]
METISVDKVPVETRPKKRIRWTEAMPEDKVPEEIIHDILLLLPIKSLLTCTAVCKSWRSLIQSSAFIRYHLSCATIQINSQNKDDAQAQLLLLHSSSKEDRKKSYSLHWDSGPSFREYYKPTDPPLAPHLSCAVEIWSLARGSWNRLSDAVVPAKFSPGNFTHDDNAASFVNGALHWIQGNHRDDKFIVSFDLSTELFGKILMPTSALKRSKKWTLEAPVGKEFCYVSRYGDCLAFFVKRQNMLLTGDVRFHLWVMKDYGVAESWSKLFIISTQKFVDRPLGFRKNGQVVLSYVSRTKFYDLVEPNTKQCDHFRMDGYCPCTNAYRFMDYFVESIVLLDQPNAISY